MPRSDFDACSVAWLIGIVRQKLGLARRFEKHFAPVVAFVAMLGHEFAGLVCYGACPDVTMPPAARAVDLMPAILGGTQLIRIKASAKPYLSRTTRRANAIVGLVLLSWIIHGVAHLGRSDEAGAGGAFGRRHRALVAPSACD